MQQVRWHHTGKAGRTGKALEATAINGDNEKAQWLRIYNAQLRYYLHIADPDSLSDEEWAKRYNELVWIRNKEAGKKQ